MNTLQQYDEKWNCELKMYERIFPSVCHGRKIECKSIKTGNEIGYTSSDGIIYIAYDHTIMSGLNENQKMVFRMGVFAHETLHQCLTNFSYYENCLSQYNTNEKYIFQTFVNTLEDPSIEYFAPHVFGGDLLESLHFKIQHIYKKSRPINEAKSPFSQFIMALIQFGDRGILKGSFTFPDAEKYFNLVAPLYNQGIETQNNAIRIDIAGQCMEITQQLWEKEIQQEETIENLQQELEKIMENNQPLSGKNSNDANFHTDNKDFDCSNKIAAEQRQKTIDGLNNSSDDKSSDKGNCDSVTPNNMDNNMECTPCDSDFNGYPEDNSSSIDCNAESEAEWMEIDNTIFERIERLISEETRQTHIKYAQSHIDCSLDSMNDKLLKCFNELVMPHPSYLSKYNKQVQYHQKMIDNITKSFYRILSNNCNAAVRYTSGKYNITRGAVLTTAKIFDKKREVNNITDTSVLLLVDLSGSMVHDLKMENAITCTIILTEVFHNIGIPCKVIGFHADINGYDVLHHHYTDWKYNKQQASTLISMNAFGNNRDGSSIRYAAQVLNHSNSNRKILFVISDGQPNSHKYKGLSAITDTAGAIRDARKHMNVFSLALGNSDIDIIHSIYGKDFIHVTNPNDLTITLVKKIEKILF